MSSRVIVSTRVRATPERAFVVFVEEIALWWRDQPLFRLNGRADGRLSFEGRPPVRLIETYPDGRFFVVGEVRVFEPPHRIVFDWRQADFAPLEVAEVEARFEALGDSVRVSIEHRGFDVLPAGHRARHGFPEAVFLTRRAEAWRRDLAVYAGRAAAGTAVAPVARPHATDGL